MPSRHHLVWFQGEFPDPRITEWARRGWPGIVRRGSATWGKVALGITLPLAEGKCRIPFEATAITFRPPPELKEALAAAPVDWQPALKAIAGLFDTAGLQVRVFGSLMWQHLTGQAYLTDHSDLDLLCMPCRLDLLPLVLKTFSEAQAMAPFRVDGEIYLPDHGWAAWRELLQPNTATILCKTDYGEHLVDRSLLPLD